MGWPIKQEEGYGWMFVRARIYCGFDEISSCRGAYIVNLKAGVRQVNKRRASAGNLLLSKTAYRRRAVKNPEVLLLNSLCVHCTIYTIPEDSVVKEAPDTATSVDSCGIVKDGHVR